ncbi:MAG: ABC transporter ATP-binding protein, partial [Proteobacteria bacterium]|nr:ABC transporter ATP-binding protein [Pseudomonadota bacterium]
MIELRALRKNFGHEEVIDGLSFTFEAKTCTGLVGPPNSGLSTLMRLIAGYLVPTDGQVLINGKDAIRDRQQLCQILAYLPEQFHLPPNLSVREFLTLCARLRQLPKPENQAKNLCEELALRDIWNMSLVQLSPSLKRLVAIAQTLLHKPLLLVLDEPFFVLDSWQRPRALQWITERAATTTCIISSHHIEELHPVCPQLLLIHQGRLLR